MGRPNWKSTQLTSIGNGRLNGPYKVWLISWWIGPNTGCFSSWWPLLGTTKLVPKKLKNNFFLIFYSLKAHAHYFTIFMYLETWRGAKLGIFTHFTFTNIPWCNQNMNSLIYVYILYTDPQLITDMITLLRTTGTQKSFLYYPLMGLRFWPWNFHQQRQGFHSREERELLEDQEKSEIWYFLEKSGKSKERKFLSKQIFNFLYMHAEMCTVELYMTVSCI